MSFNSPESGQKALPAPDVQIINSACGAGMLGGPQAVSLRDPEDEWLTRSIDLASRARRVFAIIPSN